MVLTILKIGDTFVETTVETRSVSEMQRRIRAFGAESDMRCTEIWRAQYLAQPIAVNATIL